MKAVLETKREERFSKKLTLYNLVLTLIIVLSHWTSYFAITMPTSHVRPYVESFLSVMGSAALVSFFLMSGFVLMRGVKTYGDLGKKAIRRLLFLGIPFIFWNVCNLAFEILYGLYSSSLSISPIKLLFGFTIAPYNSPTWYLLALLVLMGVAPLILLLKNHPRVTAIVTLAVFVGVYFLYIYWTPDYLFTLWIKKLIGYLPMYVLGAVLAQHAEAEVLLDGEYEKNRVLNIMCAIFAALLVILTVAGEVDDIRIKLPVYMMLPVLLWLAIPATAFEGVRITLPLAIAPMLYGAHSVLILILNSLWTQKLFGGTDFPVALDLIFLVLLFAVLYGICLGASWVMKKLLPAHIYGILFGGTSGRKMY